MAPCLLLHHLPLHQFPGRRRLCSVYTWRSLTVSAPNTVRSADDSWDRWNGRWCRWNSLNHTRGHIGHLGGNTCKQYSRKRPSQYTSRTVRGMARSPDVDTHKGPSQHNLYGMASKKSEHSILFIMNHTLLVQWCKIVGKVVRKVLSKMFDRL